MKKYLRSKGLLERHLLAGFIVFAATTFLLALIAEHISTGAPLTTTDAQLSAWLHARRSRSLTTTFWLITFLGSNVAAISIAGIVGIWLLRNRQRYWAAAIWLSVGGGTTINRVLKYVFQRSRPELVDPVSLFAGYSFPSGHAMTATVVYGALAALLLSRTDKAFKQALIILAATVLIALVGFSRIYLGAHYLSDVVAAFAEGLAWLSFSLTVIYSLWLRRQPPDLKKAG